MPLHSCRAPCGAAEAATFTAGSTHPQTGRGRAPRGAARRWTRWARAQVEGARERAGTPGRSVPPRGPVVWSCDLLCPAESVWEYLTREREEMKMMWEEGRVWEVVKVTVGNFRLPARSPTEISFCFSSCLLHVIVSIILLIIISLSY